MCILLFCAAAPAPAQPAGNQNAVLPGRLIIAFTSIRDGRDSGVYLYELDEAGQGSVIGRVPGGGKRSDHHPALSADGSLCIYASEVVASSCRIEAWDSAAEKTLNMGAVNTSPNALMAPSFAAAERLLAFEAWNRPGSSGRWDIVLYDMDSGEFVDTPILNTAEHDERKPSISADGRWIALTTNAQSEQSLTDIALYDRAAADSFEPAELNSPSMDTEPALSADGRWLAFISDRPGGSGARDVYLYDLVEEGLVELPGLNSVGQEQSPALSGDGRFVAFVSERLDGTGERDIYLYDRDRRSLLPTPGLNSPEDEYDPVIVIPPAP